MNDSIHPSQTSNDELKGLLLGITTEQQKQRDTTTEILVRVKSQDEKIASQGSLLANINQRLVKVEDKQASLERKSEKTAQSQEELEGSVLREVGVQAKKLDAVSSTLDRQDATLARQDKQLAELVDDKKQVLTILRTLKWICAGAPVAVALVTWVLAHVKF